ncbi:hypothetical protein D3C80_1584300 [compost metagenome]
MPTAFPRQTLGFGIELRRVLHQVAAATVESDLGNFFLGSGRWNHGNERQAKQASEVRLGYRRGTAGRLDYRCTRA